MIHGKDLTLKDYLKSESAPSQAQVAKEMGVTPAFVCKEKKFDDVHIRFDASGKIIGHYIFKLTVKEIPRKKIVSRNRKRLLKARIKKAAIA